MSEDIPERICHEFARPLDQVTIVRPAVQVDELLEYI